VGQTGFAINPVSTRPPALPVAPHSSQYVAIFYGGALATFVSIDSVLAGFFDTEFGVLFLFEFDHPPGCGFVAIAHIEKSQPVVPIDTLQVGWDWDSLSWSLFRKDLCHCQSNKTQCRH
jgi:hypothetical protein